MQPSLRFGIERIIAWIGQDKIQALSFFIVTLLLIFFFSPSTFACTVSDDSGQILSLPHPARRIISLSPDLTEFLFTLGADQALVGVIAGSDYPPAAKKIRQVGNYHSLDLEAILALQPDLILAWSESPLQSLTALKQFSIPVFIHHPQRLLDLPYTMERLGCLTGRKEAAAQWAKRFLLTHARLKQQYHAPSQIKVFYELSTAPLITINRNSWISEALALCGGNNIFAEVDLKQTSFAVSAEAVLIAQPEIIIAGLPPGWKKQWQLIARGKKPHLLSLNPDLLERPGPRILEGVEQLCRTIAGRTSAG